MPDLTSLLQAAQAADGAVRNQAEARLKELQERESGTFLTALASELQRDDKPEDARRLAGLILKNSVVQQWPVMDQGNKLQIKRALLQTLAAPVRAGGRHVAWPLTRPPSGALDCHLPCLCLLCRERWGTPLRWWWPSPSIVR